MASVFPCSPLHYSFQLREPPGTRTQDLIISSDNEGRSTRPSISVGFEPTSLGAAPVGCRVRRGEGIGALGAERFAVSDETLYPSVGAGKRPREKTKADEEMPARFGSP